MNKFNKNKKDKKDIKDKSNSELDILNNSFNYYIGEKTFEQDDNNKQNDGKFN